MKNSSQDIPQDRTAKELATEQRKLEAMISHSTTGIALMHGPTHIFEKVNTRWEELVSEREYIGHTFAEAYPELIDGPLNGYLKHVFETGEPFSAREMKIKVQTGTDIYDDRYYDFSYIRILDGEGVPYGIFSNMMNVTERVIIRERLEEVVKSLNIERDLRESFVAALSHDLRTPLTAAKMGAELIIRRMAEPLQVVKISARIIDNMDRADHMIRDLLDASKIKGNEKLHLNIEECSLNDILTSTIEEMVSIHGDRFIVKTKDEIIGFWDKRSIRSMIENLASNGIKYGSLLRPVTITLEEKNEAVRIIVHNEGPAIPLDQQELLFEKFHRASSASNGIQKGWGIGLTLVRGLAEAHGGVVHIRSLANEGTTFTIIIPRDSRSSAN